ncbi:MAG TPA: hypothetical protein VFC68_01450 [Treponemataceae bacterium]|nr:hypothetical protein [Treponemataceae bacterium]
MGSIVGKKRIWVIALLLFVSGLACARTDISDDIIKEIDAAFENQSREEIAVILNEHQDSSNYSKIETYMLQKAREALIFNKLDFAKVASLEVIDNNLDNYDAVDLYSLISKAIVRQKKFEEAEEAARLARIEREQKQAEQVRDKIDQEYSSVANVETGDVVYIDPVKNVRYSPFSWNVGVHVVRLGFLTTPTQNSLKYGLGASGECLYYSDFVTIAGEIGVTSLAFGLKGNDSIITSIHFVPAVAFSKLSNKLFLRFGINYRTSNPVKDGTAVSPFFSRVLGLGLLNMPLGATQINATVDYLSGIAVKDKVGAAVLFNSKLYIPLTEVGKFKLGFNTGFTDTLLFVNDGIENQAEISFSIGVGTYE